MRRMTDTHPVLVRHWHGEHPFALTVLALPPERLAEAEEHALAALGGQRLPDSWEDADPLLRRRLVGWCRNIPTEGLWHLTDEDSGTTEAEAHHRLLERTAQEWEFGRGPTAGAALPGLLALVRLSALVCRMPPDIWLDADEDLLDIYDRYTVG
ncbi:hypothetical protein CRV15_35750 (plasmid) [Streptomyces clavuligerus]|uniref:Uncharacterized protein n=2 Tax=Streptomyces clavuligerus TaxID=1901 RepID=D5SMC2_STRCL|nr:Hypothetical protein SCLAV_p1584 [Streptomyces clavuligerus]MBY6306530.1 hypothetical protein [Streptomyces clavuligerus]QCS10859.1 hypothetical protein CRV15_35750 [Streptomyces clavuligerus]QPJ97099.1 hypothetical protein GE265_28710 [Streptomyces clavuligerus]